jgi:hypothetical protein
MSIKYVKTSDDFLQNIKNVVVEHYNKNSDHIIRLYDTIKEFTGRNKNKELEFYKDKINSSINELNKELNEDIINYNLVKITYYLSKIYNLENTLKKNKKHEDYVKSILENICDMNLYSPFEYLFNMIHISKRYDYDTLIPIDCNKNLNTQNEEPELNSRYGYHKLNQDDNIEKLKINTEKKNNNNTRKLSQNKNLKSVMIQEKNNSTQKIKPPKILVISYDENRKKFSIYQGKYIFREIEEKENDKDYYLHKIYKKIKELNPDLVVCCTQNSLSCTEDHFQHYFRDLMENESMKYSLISKADATTKNDSSILSCSTKFFNESKPYNVRTRVYGNNDTLDANLSSRQITTYSYPNITKSKMSEDSASGTFNKKSIYDRWYSDISGDRPINKFYLKYIGFRRITEDSRGLGGIIYDIMICKDTTCFQNIFCNYNLKEASSKKILDAMSRNKETFFKNRQYNDSIGNEIPLIKSELQIFMITPDSVKTKKLLVTEKIKEILVQNYYRIKTGNTKQTLTNIRSFFNKIDPTKINNNVKQKEEYQAKNKKQQKILKELKIFNA